MRVQIVVWAALVVLSAADGAWAQAAPASPLQAASQTPGPDFTRIGLTLTRNSADFKDGPSEALPMGVARTSVDHRFADRLMGSVGFLCGLHPSVGHEGAEAMRGTDPDGKFLGAKLSLSFR